MSEGIMIEPDEIARELDAILGLPADDPMTRLPDGLREPEEGDEDDDDLEDEDED